MFPLDLVVFPGMFFPLHIFEPRYHRLVADRLADSEPFAICRGDDQQSSEIGCAVDIRGVIGKLPDGRLNIACQGYRRLRRVSDVESDEPYDVIRASWFPDRSEDVPVGVMEKARGAFRRAAEQKDWGPDLAVDVEMCPAALSWRIAEAGHFSDDARQALLDMDRASDRLNAESRWLTALNSE